MKSKRRYRMAARADAAEATGRNIVTAAQALVAELPFEQVTLEAVAGRAGVTLQTVLRRFGSKAGLIAAASADGAAQVEAQRAEAPVGDVRRAVKNLFDHYERWGETSLRLVAQEARFPEVAAVVRQGRAVHRGWVERTFAPVLARRRGAARREFTVQLVAVCDVYVWKLLRKDLGLPRSQAEKAVRGLVQALCR